jgi:hypothetical protein
MLARPDASLMCHEVFAVREGELLLTSALRLGTHLTNSFHKRRGDLNLPAYLANARKDALLKPIVIETWGASLEMLSNVRCFGVGKLPVEILVELSGGFFAVNHCLSVP